MLTQSRQRCAGMRRRNSDVFSFRGGVFANDRGRSVSGLDTFRYERRTTRIRNERSSLKVEIGRVPIVSTSKRFIV